jgi:hypothetical protein
MQTLQVDVKKIEKDSTDLMVKAQGMEIKTHEQYISTTDFLKSVKAMQSRVNESFNPIIEKAHEAHKEAIAQKNKFFEPLLKIEQLIKNKVRDYLAIQDKIRQEQQRKLEAEAEKKRQEAEAKAKEWADKGNDKKAEEWLDKADNAIAPVVAEVPKVEGISTRKDWDFEIIKPNEVPRDFCIPDEKTIRAFIKATKGTKPIAGIKIFEKTIIITNNR